MLVFLQIVLPSTLPSKARPMESQIDLSECSSNNSNSDFDPNAHDWNNGDWVYIVKKPMGNNRGPPNRYPAVIS